MARRSVRNVSSNDCQALLNCPFCGSEGKLKVADGILDDFTMFYCYCPNGKCIAGGTDWFRSREEAIEAWNRRAERTCHPFSGIVLGGPECREEKVWRCSECEEVISWDYEGYDPETDGPAYCEHCGSKVTGPKVVS